MKKRLIETLEKICPGAVYLQGTFAEGDAYPDDFVTFWTDSTTDNAHYNNETTSTAWSFSVMFYSTDPESVAEHATKINQSLKGAGFIPQGKGYDIPCDRPTHSGWANDFLIIETE